jgi:hypothetical protein
MLTASWEACVEYAMRYERNGEYAAMRELVGVVSQYLGERGLTMPLEYAVRCARDTARARIAREEAAKGDV